MGRLMKNFDMGLLAFCFLRAKGLGFHLRARAHLLNAFGDNSLTWFQPFCNNPFGPRSVADRDRSNADFVVGAYNRNLVTAL